MPDRILRVVAMGPRPDDRRIILIEIPMQSAKIFEFSKNLIEARLKKAGLIMRFPMFWIGKSSHVN